MMEDTQQIIVGDHIGDLRREGDALRAERQARDDQDANEGHRPAVINHGHPPARVRVGRWLMGIGAAVAGTAGDPAEGNVGRAT